MCFLSRAVFSPRKSLILNGKITLQDVGLYNYGELVTLLKLDYRPEFVEQLVALMADNEDVGLVAELVHKV